MDAWTCEIGVNIDGEDLVVFGRIETDTYDCDFRHMTVSVDHVFGCTKEGDEVEVNPIPIHWWPTIKEAILDEAQSQGEDCD